MEKDKNKDFLKFKKDILRLSRKIKRRWKKAYRFIEPYIENTDKPTV